MPLDPLTKEKAALPPEWEAWCQRGRHSVGHRRRAVLRCMNEKGEVRGFYSDILLDPTLRPTHSLYPSAEHTSFPKKDSEMVVESRIVNDMKSHLDEAEFWHAVEHLFVVGVARKKIVGPWQRRDAWLPVRHYEKRTDQTPERMPMAVTPKTFGKENENEVPSVRFGKGYIEERGLSVSRRRHHR